MAKFGDLEVKSLNIAEAAISSTVIGTTSVTVANTYGKPTQLFASATAQYSQTAATDGSATFSVSGPGVSFNDSFTEFGGMGVLNQTWYFSVALLRISPGSSETFNVSGSGSVSDPTRGMCTVTDFNITAIFEKV